MQNATTDRPFTQTIHSSLREYGRGIAGGLIFSLPLLYTMEVWWTGFIVHPERLLLYILASFTLLLGYNRYAGLHRDASWWEVTIDSVEEMGIGLLIAGLFLLLLGRLALDMDLTEITGKVVMEGMTVAIGVSIGTAQLGGGGKREGENGQTDPQPPPGDQEMGLHSVHALDQVVIGFCGAVIVGGNLAPTEEILMIGVEISAWSMVGLVLVSLFVGIVILFYSEFPGSRPLPDEDVFVAVMSRGLMTYAIALAAAAATLWFYGRFDGVSMITVLSQTIVLGVGTTLGASAGRLLLQ